jgi:hypothetical protein
MWDTVCMILTYPSTYNTGKSVYIFIDLTVFFVAYVTLQDTTHVALAILLFLCTAH